MCVSCSFCGWIGYWSISVLMNSKQRRIKRRQGYNVPYFDGFETHEERLTNLQYFLDLQRKKYQKDRAEITRILYNDKKRGQKDGKR